MKAELTAPSSTHQTLQQKLASFAAALPHDKLNYLLWEIFRLAAKGGLGEKTCALPAEEVALLFDQLIDLSAAMDQESRATLIQSPTGEEGTHD